MEPMQITVLTVDSRHKRTTAKVIATVPGRARIRLDLEFRLPTGADPHDYAYETALLYLDPA